MKKITFVSVLLRVLTLVGYNTKNMNYIIENKPSVTGIVFYYDGTVMETETRYK